VAQLEKEMESGGDREWGRGISQWNSPDDLVGGLERVVIKFAAQPYLAPSRG